MIHNLKNFLPEQALDSVDTILNKYPIQIKIVNKRSTKHGDFKKSRNGAVQITINKTLNPYQFLITLIHEFAHYITFKEYNRVKPHGLEWKRNFQHLMLPFIHPNIFPEDLIPILANHLKNPKASTSSDLQLSLALKKFDEKSGKSFIFEIIEGSVFSYNNKKFRRGHLRRTRIECVEIETGKRYLFNQNAEVDLV